MNTRTKLITAAIAVASLSFGLGAFSKNLTAALADELEFRSVRAQVWREMLRDLSPSSVDYFDGQSAGHSISRAYVLDGESLPRVNAVFLQGVTDALKLDQALIDKATKYGTIDFIP